MEQTIIIDDMEIPAYNVQMDSCTAEGKPRKILHIDFQVKHDMYHDVTTLLYKNDFTVKVPDRNLEFPAVISKYATSFTNLYEPGAVGDFTLELTEKA